MKSYPGIDPRTGWWIAILLFLGAVSCGGQPSPGEELRVLIEADPAHLDPRLGSDQASLRIHQLLYNGLVTIDEFGLPAPDLAESWEREDDRTYLFHLRPGLRFHDGRPVTARDVAYTIESIREGEVASFRKGDFEQLEAVQVVDPRTIRFRLRQPFSPFLTVLTVGIIPENRSGEIAVEPVGTGPYRLVEYRRDDRLVLAANSDYFRGVPAIPRVQFRIVPDQTSRLLELRKGSADLVYGDLFPDQIGWLQKDSRYRVITGQSWKYDYIGFNLEDPILGNPLVRKAIAHGIDRESIRTHLLQGYARLATGMLQADHWAYESQVNRYDHDIRRAAALLDQAGFPDPDGAGPE
ncbi:MAG: ABC transporter substrate-binding protein, partial [Acidobacteriota bacterium]